MRKFTERGLKYRLIVIVLTLGLAIFCGYDMINVKYNHSGDFLHRIGSSHLAAMTEVGVLAVFGVAILLAVAFFPTLLAYLPVSEKMLTRSRRHRNRACNEYPDLSDMCVDRPKTADSSAGLAEVATTVRRCYHLAGVSALAGVEDYTEGIYHGDPQTDYHEAQRRQHTYLLDEVGADPGVRLLEIGCGLGTLMLAAQARGCEVTGVTISEDQYAACQARGLRVVLSDYRALPREWTGAFDGIIINGALEHFCQPTDARDGQQDRIYENMFGILAGLLDPSSSLRRVVTTTLHFRGVRVAPSKLLRSPFLQVFDRQGFHFAILHRGYGGYYPVAGQLERCARGFFRLVREVDGTQDYGFTAEDWLRMFRGALCRRFGAALFGHFVHEPAHTFWFTASFLGPASQLWQFRGVPTPVQHFRHTWEAVSD